MQPDLVALAYPYLLPAARALGVLVVMPGLGASSVPALARLGLVAGIAGLLVSAVTPRPVPPADASAFILGIGAELALGAVMGWLITLLIEAARWAGEAVDIQIGLRAADVFDPLTSHGTSLLGQLYYMTAVTLFFTLYGHHWVLLALGESLRTLPAGALLDGRPLLDVTLEALTVALGLTVRVAAAGLAAMLLADVSLAVIGRNVPQMNVYMVGMPAKLALGLIILAGTAPLLAGPLGSTVGHSRHLLAVLLGR